MSFAAERIRYTSLTVPLGTSGPAKVGSSGAVAKAMNHGVLKPRALQARPELSALLTAIKSSGLQSLQGFRAYICGLAYTTSQRPNSQSES